MKYYKLNEEGKLELIEEEHGASFILFGMDEIRELGIDDWLKNRKGYENTLQLVRDKGYKQINRSKADKNGYSLVSAVAREYSVEANLKIKTYKIKKSTPYSVKYPLEDVSFWVEKDLANLYRYIDVAAFKTSYAYPNTPLTLLKVCEKLKTSVPADEHSDLEQALLKNDTYVKGFIFDIAGYTPNYGRGVYEVSYWATRPI